MTDAGALHWTVLSLDDFAARQLHDVLQLRSEVFVVEQQCLYQDIDGLDARAAHLLGHDGLGRLVAYARCFDRGITFAEASIGRVVTRTAARGGGLGHRLIARAIALVAEQWGPQPVRIGAQAHLRAFYERHGFVDQQRPYVEDGIAHLEMLRPTLHNEENP